MNNNTGGTDKQIEIENPNDFGDGGNPKNSIMVAATDGTQAEGIIKDNDSGTNYANLNRILITDEAPEPGKRFLKDVVQGDGEATEQVSLKFILAPRKEGGNAIVRLDIEDYRRGVRDLQFSVIERLRMHKGEETPTNMNLKAQLETAWDDQSFVMAYGAVNL